MFGMKAEPQRVPARRLLGLCTDRPCSWCSRNSKLKPAVTHWAGMFTQMFTYLKQICFLVPCAFKGKIAQIISLSDVAFNRNFNAQGRVLTFVFPKTQAYFDCMVIIFFLNPCVSCCISKAQSMIHCCFYLLCYFLAFMSFQ